jgi:transcriptional regulator with XRE-family HTH domain
MSKTSPIPELLPERLRRLREELNISQREFARRCGFSDSLISKYEKGESDPSSYFLKIMAEQLNVSTDYLVGLTDDPRGQAFSNELSANEQAVLDMYRREGWTGIIRLGADKLSKLLNDTA